jgi:hypothetical protein
MIRVQPHPALAFHSQEELPLSQRHLHRARWDRCAGGSSSNQKSEQNTTSTSGGSSPALSGADAKQILTSDAPILTTTKGNISLTTSNKYDYDSNPTITKQAFDAITTLIGQALDSTGDAAKTAATTVQQQAGDTSDLISAVLAKDQSTAANTASGGQTESDSTWKWILGIGAAVVGLFTLPKLFKK